MLVLSRVDFKHSLFIALPGSATETIGFWLFVIEEIKKASILFANVLASLCAIPKSFAHKSTYTFDVYFISIQDN